MNERMNSKIIDAYSQEIINKCQCASDEELQELIDRPFKPSPYNSSFDLEKYCANITLTARRFNSEEFEANYKKVDTIILD